MGEEKLYAVKNDEGEYWDFDGSHGFWQVNRTSCPIAGSEDNAKNTVKDHGGHVVTLVEEQKKVLLTKEQAKIVEKARDQKYPASYISGCAGLGAGYDEELLMNAYVNGYTVEKEKKYVVYKELGGKHTDVQYAQACKSPYYPETVSWIVVSQLINASSCLFTEAEIEHYGLQDCEKVWCDSVD